MDPLVADESGDPPIETPIETITDRPKFVRTKSTCSNCAFFRAGVETGMGRCHRYARSDDLALWPEVHKDEWCGEFWTSLDPAGAGLTR